MLAHLLGRDRESRRVTGLAPRPACEAAFKDEFIALEAKRRKASGGAGICSVWSAVRAAVSLLAAARRYSRAAPCSSAPSHPTALPQPWRRPARCLWWRSVSSSWPAALGTQSAALPRFPCPRFAPHSLPIPLPLSLACIPPQVTLHGWPRSCGACCRRWPAPTWTESEMKQRRGRRRMGGLAGRQMPLRTSPIGRRHLCTTCRLLRRRAERRSQRDLPLALSTARLSTARRRAARCTGWSHCLLAAGGRSPAHPCTWRQPTQSLPASR